MLAFGLSCDVGVEGLGEGMSELVGDEDTGEEDRRAGGRCFFSLEMGDELPDGSLMGVKPVMVGRNMLKLFRRRLSDMMSDLAAH